MVDITIKRLNKEEVLSLMSEEHADHMKEIQGATYNAEWNPDVDTYTTMLDEGLMLPLAAFDGDKPIGYLNILVSTYSHDYSKLLAVADSFYIRPEYRRLGIMQELVAYAEKECKAVGIYSISLTVMAGKGGGQEFVESLGFELAELHYSKVL
jgi:GNAT superfamily N-acetyltransferase